MLEFNREAVLVQRYISQLPMFMDAGIAMGLSGDGGAAEDLADCLEKLYRNTLEVVKEEVVLMKSVFPSPAMAVESLVQRIVEQRVGLALEEILASFHSRPFGREVDRIQGLLALLVQINQRTTELASSMELVCGEDVAVGDRVSGLLAETMKDYPAPETRLGQLLFSELGAEGGPVDLAAVAQVGSGR